MYNRRNEGIDQLMPVMLELPTAARHARAKSYDPERASLASRLLLGALSGGDTAAYHRQSPRRLPPSMLQPVTFHGEDDDRATRVKLKAVDESEDMW
ncbi:hypothetical protein GCM10010468_35640 [Actinocorallia longicatena]|uniref:Uncharacterized protein n=1 Tax=Actinocorallia longicatena TaxID=111803 RepID=A0ABP6QDH9_9ACTN